MAQLHGQGPIGAPGATSDVFDATTAINPPIQVGSKMSDGAGNVYLFVSYTGTVVAKQPVEITDTFTAQALATTGRGPVGIVTANGTSDQAGWVQIYGLATVLLGMSGTSPSDAANGPTTLSTSLQTRFILGTSLTSPNGIGWVSGNVSGAAQWYVEGITVGQSFAPGAVSGTVSGQQPEGIVFLNYPHIVYQNYG